MSAIGEFIPGLQLGRMLYEEAGREIVERIVPRNAYGASFIGKGSDVLGLDSERSTDHDWGPRFQIFLDPDGADCTASRLGDELRRRLPSMFKGFAVGVPQSAETTARPNLIEIYTVSSFLRRYLALSDLGGLQPLDWLTFPEQRLLEITSGEIFHDPSGALGRFRETLGEYPRDVWLYRMACQWQRLSQEEAFVGRCAETGDIIGMKVAAARIVRDVMKLCFLMERRYAPYDKWLGTAFARLSCAPAVTPLLSAALDVSHYSALEPALIGIYRLLGEMHNGLKVTGPMDPSPRQFFARPYMVMRADRFANALLRAVQCEEIRRIPVRMGAIDQFIDCTDFIEHTETYRKVLALFR
jgi:hypothetical protein